MISDATPEQKLEHLNRYLRELALQQHHDQMRTPPGYGKKNMARICTNPWQPHERVKRGNPARNPTALV